RRKRKGDHSRAVSLKDSFQLTRRKVVKADIASYRCRDRKPMTVGGQRDSIDLSLLAKPHLTADGADRLSRPPVPHPHNLVEAGRYQKFSVGRKDDAPDQCLGPALVEHQERLVVASRNRTRSDAPSRDRKQSKCPTHG